MHAKTFRQRFSKIRQAIPIRIPQQPQIRNAREINIPFARQHSRRNSRHQSLEIISEGRDLIRAAVAILVHQQSQPLGFNLQIMSIIFSIAVPVLAVLRRNVFIPGNEHFLKKIRSIQHCPKRKIIVHPIRIITNIKNRSSSPMRLHHIRASLFVEREINRILNLRFRRERFDAEPGHHSKFPHREFHFRGRIGLSERVRRQSNQKDEETKKVTHRA